MEKEASIFITLKDLWAQFFWDAHRGGYLQRKVSVHIVRVYDYTFFIARLYHISKNNTCWPLEFCHHMVKRVIKFFWDFTVQLRHSQRTHTRTPINKRTQTLSLWASSKTEPANPRDWRSHHRRLAVDGNVAYHLMHNAVKSQNIRSHGKSNTGPQMLPRLL